MRQLYVNYAAVLAASTRIPIEQVIDKDNSIDPALLRKAFEKRMDDLDQSGALEWQEAVDLTDPILEDEHGNPINNLPEIEAKL